jgi:hypothetical protein
MQRFVASYPAFRQKNNIVSKHVALVSELARLVEAQSVLGCGCCCPTAVRQLVETLMCACVFV